MSTSQITCMKQREKEIETERQRQKDRARERQRESGTETKTGMEGERGRDGGRAEREVCSGEEAMACRDL